MKKRIKEATASIKKGTPKKEEQIKPFRFIKSGCTTFDLACSDSIQGAYMMGRMVNLIGDSSSGKTLSCLTLFAEASLDKRLDNYRFIYDDAEYANTFDIEYLFGKKVAERIEPAGGFDTDFNPINSNTIQDFHCHIFDACDDGRPFIYVLDSFDSISSDEELEKTEELREAKRKGTKAKGSYDMTKQKGISKILREITNRISKTNSILIIISQTRDNIDPMSPQKLTRSGGRALKFYATHEVWLTGLQKIKVKDRIIGSYVRAKITKNKVTGKLREATFPIYYDYGIDDLESCINFLVTEKYWSKATAGGVIDAHDFEIKGTVKKLIAHIEENNLEHKLRKIVSDLWCEIEEELKLNRKRKYE